MSIIPAHKDIRTGLHLFCLLINERGWFLKIWESGKVILDYTPIMEVS